MAVRWPVFLARRAPVAVLVVVAAGVYAGSLTNGFVFDDATQVLSNPWIRDLTHFSEIFTRHVWAFADRDSDYYRPLMHVVYAAIYVSVGPVAAVFHGVNVLLHVATTLLVFALIRRLVSPSGGRDATPFPLAAFLASLVFAAHPIHVEAVAWVSGLPDLGCAAFSVAGLLAFVAAWDSPSRSFSLHIAGAACFLVSALFKEPGVTFPAVVFALDLARRPRGGAVAYWAARYGALALSGLIYTALRWGALGGLAPRASEGHFGFSQALDLAGVAVWRYVAMVTVPHPLNAFQTLDASTGLPSWVALVVFPVAALVAMRRDSVAWTAALAIFLIPLAPALYAPALLPGLDNPWAERYVYLPSVGFAVVVGIACAAVSGAGAAGRRIAVAVVVSVTLLFSGMTIARIGVWRDDLTLWSDTAAKSPDSGYAHGALGYALFVRGDIAAAIAQYELAIRMKPDHADSHLNLGVALALMGRHEAALSCYAEALRLQPRRAVAHADLALSLSALGRHDEALLEARRAADLRPDLGGARHALGVALGNAGRVTEAAAEFRRAIELDPTDAQSRANLEQAEALLRRR